MKTFNPKKYNTTKYIVDAYEDLGFLGKGNYGQVYLSRQPFTNKEVAIKVIDLSKTKKEDQDSDAFNEESICESFVSELNHPNIVSVFDVIYKEDKIFYVMECVDGSELLERISEDGRINEQQAKIWFRELIEGVNYLHTHGIVHRDLKPENVLLDENHSIRICDFGFGKKFDAGKKLTTYCGSPFYAAPEMVTATPYHGPPVDMWSCGVILYAMLTGKLPFQSSNMNDLFYKIIDGKYPEPTFISPVARHLIKSLLRVKPKKRMTAKDALKHPWLAEKKKTVSKIPYSIFHPKYDIYRPYNQLKQPLLYGSHPYLPSTLLATNNEEQNTYRSKATKFLFNLLVNKKVAPTEEKETTPRKTKPFISTGKIKKFFTSLIKNRRLETTVI